MNFEQLKKESYNRSNSNYKILDYNNKSDLCYIFCSSNGLFFGKGSKDCENLIINENYEWEKIAKHRKIQNKAKKIIFLRDIFCHFYVDGLNSKINSIQNIISLLKEETKGLHIILVGFSSGGYLSMVLGYFLPKVERVFSFGGVFSLYEWTGAQNNYHFSDMAFLVTHLGDDKSIFFDIRYILENKKYRLLHFYGCHNIADKIQINILPIILKCSKSFFPIKTTKHGGNLTYYDYIKLFTSSDKRLERIEKHFEGSLEINKDIFSIVNLGTCLFLVCKIRSCIRKVLKKLFK